MNGKLVPLDYELRTGDSVEILTSKAQGEGPSQDWLQFVATPRARDKIRQWFAAAAARTRSTGRDCRQDVRCASRTCRSSASPPRSRSRQVAEDLKYPDLDALYVAVGEGHVSPQSVRRAAVTAGLGTPDEDVTEVPLARPVRIAEARRLARASWSRAWPTSG